MREKLFKGFQTSIINSSFESDEKYQYKLISNKDEKIVSILRENMESCDEFIFSVAFITQGGLTLFLEQLKVLEIKNIKGKILTGDYLNFTEPKALEKLLSFKNIELKIAEHKSFHPKAYFFRKGDIWTIIIGSANLTQGALTTNFEWNLKINSINDGKIVKDILSEFFYYFDNAQKITFEKLEKYKNIYKHKKDLEEKFLNFLNKPNTKDNKLNLLKFVDNEPIFEKNEQGNQNKLDHIYDSFDRDNKNYIEEEIVPNSMQKIALEELEKARHSSDRALVISATGTGKTYLTAFDVKNSEAKKVLFIAHRKVILEKSKYSFSKIIKDKELKIFESAIEKNVNKDEIIFAMIQTLSKDENLEKFSKDYFDYIIIDEVHHSGAKTYQKLINYFKPKFLLGLTATPERTDNFDIYNLFNHNIAYEIRLHDALRENLLSPFHYFGISDIEVDGKILDEKFSIKDLTSDERVEHILEKSEYYGYSGDSLKCLIFVSNLEEAGLLYRKFLIKDKKISFLSSSSSEAEREKAIDDLEKGIINYIITVDIFNEGVDIPSINQVILLRPTLSSIIYIQQLGRGLRKAKGKEFTVILDFIGNYEKNFLIPVAISQNNSFDKDFMKRFLMNPSNLIPGESSISFDEISKERIFENINKVNFSNRKLIEHDFKLLQMQLGRVPFLSDFFERNMLSPAVILKYKKDYDEVLKTFSINLGELNKEEKQYLTFLSDFFTPAKRVHEMIILKLILQKNILTEKEVTDYLKENYNLDKQEKNIENAFKHLSKEIFKNLSTVKIYNKILSKENGKYHLVKDLLNSYKENFYFKNLIDDLINYNLSYSQKYYENYYKESIKLYGEYTKREAFWNMNLDFNNGYQVSGYTPFENEKELLIFITLESSSARSIYTNDFYDNQTFSWFSKTNRYLDKGNKETIEKKIANSYYNINVFLKKSDGENFYYLGEVDKILSAEETKEVLGKPVVKYIFKLKQEIPKNLFNYFNL